MTKLLLALGLVATLAAPALAQSTYDNSAANVGAGGNSGAATPGGPNDFTKQDTAPAAGVDATVTNGIVRNDPVNHPMPQRGDQGAYFGANGR